MIQAVIERGADMAREISDVTLDTFPAAVRRIGLRPGQKFKITIEDDDQETRRQKAYERMQEISAKATALAQADGIVTDEDVERFLDR
jgi:hypothetical protein